MLEEWLRTFLTADWSAARDIILNDAHEVDRPAVRIWDHFFPLALKQAYERGDTSTIDRQLRINGSARLADGLIDSSPWFLYGHRYWQAVKASVRSRLGRHDALPADLASVVRTVADDAAVAAGVDRGLVIGVAYVALMTLRQTGAAAFNTTVTPDTRSSLTPASPDAVLARRRHNDSQGLRGLLRTAKRYSVVFDERRNDGRFPILQNQELTTAAAADTRDYLDGPRRFQEGPIPAQCRSAACGTCWIGVLGGGDRLSAIEPAERRKLQQFGYIDTQASHPIIRLACQARAFGRVTIVIPPWNGFIARVHSVNEGDSIQRAGGDD